MKVRLKFRNNFHSVTVESTSTLSDVLSVASEVFKIGISNVQLSLNAKDYFSLDDCNRTLSELGIVSGDILYVNSLEVLDDIKKCVEKELLSNITNLLQTIPIPHQTVCHWVSIALIVILEDKDFHPNSPFADQFAKSNRDIIRLKVVYSRDPTVHLVFTIFSTGNLINLACGVLESNIRCQMLLPIRDFVVPFTLTAKDTAIVPQHVFRNLQTLTIRIKDELLEPVLVAIHAQLGLPERLLLCTLPSEILTRILILLPLSALGKLMLASSNMRRQIVNCSPVWRIHLSRLNAKNQSMLDAALTRQRQQQQRQQQQQAQSPSAPAATSAGAIDPNCGIATDIPQTIPDSLSLASEEHSLSDVEPDNGVTCLYYERFVARYRSLLTQRRCRGLSPSFV